MIVFSACGHKADVICDHCGKTCEVEAIRMKFIRVHASWWFISEKSQACGAICALILADKTVVRS